MRTKERRRRSPLVRRIKSVSYRERLFVPQYSLPHVDVQTGETEKNARWTLTCFDSGSGRSVCEDNALCASLRQRFLPKRFAMPGSNKETILIFLGSLFDLSSDVHRPCAIPLSRPTYAIFYAARRENECHGLKAEVVQLERRPTNAIISFHQLL